MEPTIDSGASAAPTALNRVRAFAMPAGRLPPARTWLRQVGELRLRPGGRWMRFQAEQTFEADFGFRWRARVRIAPLISLEVVDSFGQGRGTGRLRLLGRLQMGSARGPAVDEGAAYRSLAELPWHPAGFSDDARVRWTNSPGGLRGTWARDGLRAEVAFEVDADGRILAIRADHRPRQVGRSFVPTPWSGTFADYRRFGDVCVPTRVEVTWHLADGPFTWFRARVCEFGCGQPPRALTA
jgi:Family of unknown function (DUF6544)